MTDRQLWRLRLQFAAKGRMTRTDVHQALGRNRPSSEIEPVLEEMVQAGELRRVRERSRAGRSVDIYEMVEGRGKCLQRPNMEAVVKKLGQMRHDLDALIDYAAGGRKGE